MGIWAPSQYPKRRLFVRSREVSKPRDLYLKLSDRSEIWQALRQHCCRCACQISKRYDNLKYQSRGFETSRDLTKRRLIRYWDGALYLFSQPSAQLSDCKSHYILHILHFILHIVWNVNTKRTIMFRTWLFRPISKDISTVGIMCLVVVEYNHMMIDIVTSMSVLPLLIYWNIFYNKFSCSFGQTYNMHQSILAYINFEHFRYTHELIQIKVIVMHYTVSICILYALKLHEIYCSATLKF